MKPPLCIDWLLNCFRLIGLVLICSKVVEAQQWQEQQIAFNGEVTALCFSSDCKSLGVAVWPANPPINSRVRAYIHLCSVKNLKSQSSLTLSGYDDTVEIKIGSLCFIGGSKQLIGTEQSLGWGWLWDIKTSQLRQNLPWSAAIATTNVVCSGDGTLLAVGIRENPPDSGAISVYDTATGHWRRLQSRQIGDIGAIAISPHAKMIASLGQHNTLKIVDADTGKALRVLRKHRTEWTGIMAFVTDYILALLDTQGRVQLWDLRTGHFSRSFKAVGSLPEALAASPQKRLLAGIMGHKVIVWDMTTGAIKKTLQTQVNWVPNLVFSSDGSMLACGGIDGIVQLWHI